MGRTADRHGFSIERMLYLAAGFGLFAWFLFVVRGGLASWFDADDLMNLHYYWSRGWPALLKASLEFWSSYYRPGGGLFYRSIYALWGFHPPPFRIAALVLLSIDFALLAVVVRQLTGSRWAALIALLVMGVNPAFGGAYFDTGTIYDVLAYTFFWGAFAAYVRIREQGKLPGWRALLLLFCLFAAALDAKEIAVCLPLAVGLYELVWHPPANWRFPELWRWVREEGRFAAIGGLAGIGYFLGKRFGPESLWTSDAYRPRYSVHAYFASLSHYLQQLIFRPVTLSLRGIVLLLAAMVAVAVISRRRALLWGVGFIAVGILPIAFIPPRNGVAYLVPSVGWAVYAGGLLDWLLATLAGSRIGLRRALQVALFALLAAIVMPWQRKAIAMEGRAAHQEQGRFRSYIGQIHALIPAPRKGAHILLLSDADGRDDYDVFFVVRLFYGDPALDVSRMKVWKDHNVRVDPAGYDYVLDWIDNRFVLAGHK